MLTEMHARKGRHQQRYENNFRLVAGCVPYRIKSSAQNQNDESFDWLEVLMISSANRTDLVFPKGGWENDETLHEAAGREALEEAGVRGMISETLLGVWEFRSKRFQNNCSMEGSCRGYMFGMEVTEELDSWPEQDEHKRRWLSVREALQLCRYEWMREALKACLRVLSVKPSMSMPMISEISTMFHLMKPSSSEQMVVL
ncbi:putative NUDIX hydrolase domain-containing protein [Dioscorea sansibarensis]